MEIEKNNEQDNERKAKICYTDKTHIIGSYKSSTLTPYEYTGTLTLSNCAELTPAKSETKHLIEALSKLKSFSDYFRIEIRTQQAYIIVENKDRFNESIKYELLFTDANNYSDTREFSTTYNIKYFLSIMKEFKPDAVTIDIAENQPLVIFDSNNLFALAPVVF